tara:strand:- start:520 stop:696 length:177 start_codon:yes stop_codon:yes gene_type:complete
MKTLMQMSGGILIFVAIADFVASYLGINLTPFLPDGIARFSPIIIGGIGWLLVSAGNK